MVHMDAVTVSIKPLDSIEIELRALHSIFWLNCDWPAVLVSVYSSAIGVMVVPLAHNVTTDVAALCSGRNGQQGREDSAFIHECSPC